jgi:hypothetical protein
MSRRVWPRPCHPAITRRRPAPRPWRAANRCSYRRHHSRPPNDQIRSVRPEVNFRVDLIPLLGHQWLRANLDHTDRQDIRGWECSMAAWRRVWSCLVSNKGILGTPVSQEIRVMLVSPGILVSLAIRGKGIPAEGGRSDALARGGWTSGRRRSFLLGVSRRARWRLMRGLCIVVMREAPRRGPHCVLR